MNRRLLVGLLKYGLGIAILAYLISSKWNPPASGGPGLRDAFSHPLSWNWLALAVVLYACGCTITFVRWYFLVRAQDLPFRPVDALRLGLVGFFWSTFLPGGVGGDLVKAALICREQSRRTVSVATVLIDRAVGLWGIFWMVAIFGGLAWLMGDPILTGDAYLRSIVVTNLAVLLGTIVLCVVLLILPARRAERFAGRLTRIPKVGRIAAEFWRAIWMYRLKRAAVAGSLLLSLAVQFFLVLSFFAAAHVFRTDEQATALPSLAQHFLLVPIGIAVQALFPAPGGIGGAEAVYGWLFGRVAATMGTAGLLASLAFRLVIWGLGLVGYFVYLRMKPGIAAVSAVAAAQSADPSANGSATSAAVQAYNR